MLLNNLLFTVPLQVAWVKYVVNPIHDVCLFFLCCFICLWKSGNLNVFLHYSMRTHSRNTDAPRSSCGHAVTPPPNPPPAPTLADVVDALMNVSADNARVLQALAQNGIPVPQGR